MIPHILTGCGGDEDPPTAFTVSGIITVASGSAIDSDVNDPYAEPADNNSFANALPLPNPATVGGFITSSATGNAGDRFALMPDQSDWYQTSLNAGQSITLTISDHDGTPAIDMDLHLYTTSNPATPVTSSTNRTGPTEQISITTSGAYYIEVRAILGKSNYILTIGQPLAGAGGAIDDLNVEAEFVPGEVIVTFKDDALPATLSPGTALAMRAEAIGMRAVAGRPGIPMLFRLGNAVQRRSTFSILNISPDDPDRTSLSEDETYALKRDTIRVVRGLRARKDVKTADLNYIHHALATPNDQYYPSQWHYPLVNLPQAWDITKGDPAVVVAVVDSGILLNHPDLQGNLIAGYDFISDTPNGDLTRAADGDGIDPNPDDPGDGNTPGASTFHGTHVAGTIAAASNNATGVAGASWSTKIMPIRALGKGGGTSFDIQQGILYAAGIRNGYGLAAPQPAQIINLSIGTSGSSQTEQDIYTRVRNEGNNGNGVIIIAAAGNSNTSAPVYPASYNGVVSVSAVDMVKNRAPYSNFGPSIDLAAPGGNTRQDLNGDAFPDGVWSTCGDDSSGLIRYVYKNYQGTSMAAPHVAGIVALMKAKYPDLTPDDLDALILNGLITEDLAANGADVRDDSFGYGMIDALEAVQQANILAGGGALPPTLQITPGTLDFGTAATQLTLQTAKVGGGTLNISADDNASWLLLNSPGTGDGLGDYTVTVDRKGLLDGTYNATITFQTNIPSTTTVPVVMRVGTAGANGDAGLHWVIAVNPITKETAKTTTASVSNGTYRYALTGLEPGEYQVIAGTDSDNDGFICDAGEACSGYPTLSDLLHIVVADNVSGVDFTTGFTINFPTSSTGQTYGQPKGYSKYGGKGIQ